MTCAGAARSLAKAVPGAPTAPRIGDCPRRVCSPAHLTDLHVREWDVRSGGVISADICVGRMKTSPPAE